MKHKTVIISLVFLTAAFFLVSCRETADEDNERGKIYFSWSDGISFYLYRTDPEDGSTENPDSTPALLNSTIYMSTGNVFVNQGMPYLLFYRSGGNDSRFFYPGEGSSSPSPLSGLYSPNSAKVSPDVMKILFEDGGGFFIYFLQSNSIFTVPSCFPYASTNIIKCMDWFNDSERVILLSNHTGTAEVYTYSFSTSELNPRTNFGSGGFLTSEIALSPDNRKIALMTDVFSTGATDIVVMDTDSYLSYLDTYEMLNVSNPQLAFDSAIDSFPVWSPDGKKIAFLYTPGATALAVCVAESDGSGMTQITQIAGSEGCSGISWSPYGTKILFAADWQSANNPDIYSINPDGSGLKQLTFIGTSGQRARNPFWSIDR